MAIYHFSVKVISRASGSSAVASAAYRAATRLRDERLDRSHDFSNKAGVVHSEVMLPDGAPERWRDRERLWNDVEAAELRRDAQLAREIEFAIPRELDQAEGITLARDFVQREFVERGMVADLNVHWDMGADGEAKPHAHVMLAMRDVEGDGFGKKVRDWNGTELLKGWRVAWEAHANARLAELGIEARIDHRSYRDQEIELEPQNKIGPAGARRLERGQDAERAEEHLNIAQRNGAAIIARPEIGLDGITRQQSTFTIRDLAKFADRHSADKEQFDQVLGAMRGCEQLVALGRDGRNEERFTSREMIATEQRMARAADALERLGHAVQSRSVEHAAATAAKRGLNLSGEQRDALDHVTRGQDLKLVIGYAGSGKSAMLGVARDAWAAEGYTVQGAALSGIAAENLEGGSGIASRTIAAHEHAWGQGRDLLTPNDVLVIDEAGMIGSRQMERVLHEARMRGSKVVLVGDAAQLQAIEAGAAFRALAERHGAVEITEVRRQHEQWQRDATRHLATGRTVDALAAYRDAGMVHESATREEARIGLIDAWDRDRAPYPASSRLILTHTNQECDELNALARDRLTHDGMLGTDIAVETTRGEGLFASQDRIMFLRNERGLGVKNGTLATIEQVDRNRLVAVLDDGRRVAFDLKDYRDITHGYAATIHKSQGVTVDRTYVLATPGLDRHAAYVALSRHRDALHLHYGRDDFADADRLGRILARERAKDTTLDYDSAKEIFGRQRGYDRSNILDTLANEQLHDPAHVQQTPAPARGRFDGLRLGSDRSAPADHGPFAGLRLGGAAVSPPLARDVQLGAAVQRYARAIDEMQGMIVRHLPAPEVQKRARVLAAQALDAVQPLAVADLDTAFTAEPKLVGEAAAGRTAAAIQAMQLEAEIRSDPALRADRFVQAWRQLRMQRDRLGEIGNEQGRTRVDAKMRVMAKGLAGDPAVASALAKRTAELGVSRKWSPEWSPCSADGGMPIRAGVAAIGQQLIDSLGRDRDIGIGR